MTAIVTLDQAVPALTQDIGLSTTAENTALKAALAGIGLSTGPEIARATITANANPTIGKSFTSGATGTPVTFSVVWDVTTNASFGSWNVSKTIFTFNRDVTATVSAGILGYMTGSSGNNMVLATRLAHSGTLQAGMASTGSGDSSSSLVTYEGSGSITRMFTAGSTIELIGNASSTTPGNVTGAQYGSLFGVSSFMDIVALN